MKTQLSERCRKKIWLTVSGLFIMLAMVAGPAFSQDVETKIETVTPEVFGAEANIVIKGTGFAAEDQLLLNNRSLENLQVSPTSIRAMVPKKAKVGKRIVLRRGKKKVTTFTAFTFAKAPLVRVSKPAFGVPGQSMKVLGVNLDTVTILKVGGTAIKLDSQNKTSLTFTVPAGLATGALEVSGPGGAATMKKPLEVFYPPEITLVTPAAAFPGDVVTVTGKHFDTRGLRVQIGKKTVKPTEITDNKISFTIPKMAKTGPVTLTARRIRTESKSPLTVYVVPVVTTTPRLIQSPGTLVVRGKNLDVVQGWTIGGQKLAVDSSAKKNFAKQVQLLVPKDWNLSGPVTGTYLGRSFAARKSTSVMATPRIDAVRYDTDKTGANCEYAVLGKNLTAETIFKCKNKKLQFVRPVSGGALVSLKGACNAKYNRISAQNGRFRGNEYPFNADAGGYTTTATESLHQLQTGYNDYSPAQIESDLALMDARYKGSPKSFTAKGKAAEGTTQRAEVEKISTGVGEELVRLTLAEQCLCKAMAPGKNAAAGNAGFGTVLDRVVRQKKRLMEDVLIPLWSQLPKASMAKKIRLNTLDDRVLAIDAATRKQNACTSKYYGKKLVADAGKATSLDVPALHEKAMMGALSNLSTANTNAIVAEKELKDALYSFSGSRMTHWLEKAKSSLNRVQKSETRTVGKGAGRNKRVQQSSKQKPAGKTGK